MKDDDINIFIKGTEEYFKLYANLDVEIDVPYVKGDETLLLAHSGIIGISGSRKGCVYFTATNDLLKELVSTLVGSGTPSDEQIKDVVGEIANTIAGNARNHYGDDFQISVPVRLSGGDTSGVDLSIKEPCFVFPVKYKSHKAFLVVGLEE